MMDCGICTEPFDAARRRPKMFPCGHSACLACVRGFRERRCPECRREFAGAAETLPDNFVVLRGLESTLRRPGMWCCNCGAVAKPVCFENHLLKSIKTALKDEVEQLQVRASQLAKKLPKALHQDGDVRPEQALRVLELARKPGTTLEFSVRERLGDTLTATWSSPPIGQHGTEEDIGVEVTNILVLTLAMKGLWQQRGVKRQLEGDGEEQEGQGLAEIPTARPTARPTAVLPVMECLEICPNPLKRRREEALQTVRRYRVRKIMRVWGPDPDSRVFTKVYTWLVGLLQLAAPHLEEFEGFRVYRGHLLAAHALPRLRRLKLDGVSRDQSVYPAALPPLPANHVGLRWLSVYRLPRETTVSLIRAHAGTLEELWLWVGSVAGREWPVEYDGLHVALGRCGFVRLRRLLLARHWPEEHDTAACAVQVRAVQAVLPGVQVQCDKCEGVKFNF